MTPLEINRIVTRLLAYRDERTDRGERDLLADACNALDGYAKQTRFVEPMIEALATAFGKVDDPGTSDLDDEQPMSIHVPLGVLRRGISMKIAAYQSQRLAKERGANV